MRYPSRSDYATAIRNPQIAFRKVDPRTKKQRDLDAELARGQGIQRMSRNGMPSVWSASGGYAIAFKYQTPKPKKIWAVRCFFRANYDIRKHYQMALAALPQSACAHYFVETAYLHEGIRVQGQCYPILKMEWVDGDNLKTYIKANLSKKQALLQLAERWRSLCLDFKQAGIAHGDIQHGNVLVMKDRAQLSFKLIDYDSLHFQSHSVSMPDVIKGLPGYQPPSRKALKSRCLAIDFFPQLIVYVCILALAEDPSLWQTYQLDQTEHLLFSKTDFVKCDQARIFQDLKRLPQPIPRLTEQIQQLCRLEHIQAMPSLEEAITGQRVSIPTYQPPVAPPLPPMVEPAKADVQSTLVSKPQEDSQDEEGSPLSGSLYRQWAQEYYRKLSRGSTL